MAKKPTVQNEDKYVIRFPDGMRDRIKKAAERSGRSMNAEIVAALEVLFPPEPTLEDVVEKVHSAIALASHPWTLPYRRVLIDALDELSDRLTKGIEYDQFRAPFRAAGSDWEKTGDRLRRWQRVKKYGVEQKDLEEEIRKGMLHSYNQGTAKFALEHFKEGDYDSALRQLRLHDMTFEQPEQAYRAIEQGLRAHYLENWGDPDAPWEPDGSEDYL